MAFLLLFLILVLPTLPSTPCWPCPPPPAALLLPPEMKVRVGEYRSCETWGNSHPGNAVGSSQWGFAPADTAGLAGDTATGFVLRASWPDFRWDSGKTTSTWVLLPME